MVINQASASSESIEGNQQTWHVTPRPALLKVSQGLRYDLDIVLKTQLTGDHCLYIDELKLKCFSVMPSEFTQDVTISQPSLLNLLNSAGVSIAQQRLVVQYLKLKRRCSWAPWSLF